MVTQPNIVHLDPKLDVPYQGSPAKHAFHSIYDGSNQTEQLRMFLTVAGGTGKTRVLNSVKCLFSQHRRLHELRCGSYMAFAAVNIGGTAVHQLPGLDTKGKQRPRPRKLLWKGVKILFIDEVSMLGQAFFHQAS